MSRIEIYTTMLCPFCSAAKQLLKAKGVSFKELDVMFKPGLRREMTERAGGDHKVPQIFVDGVHIGNCDRIHDLDRAGRLDAILEGAT